MATAAVLVFVVFLIGIAVSIPIGISMILGSIAPMFLVDKGGNINTLCSGRLSPLAKHNPSNSIIVQVEKR